MNGLQKTGRSFPLLFLMVILVSCNSMKTKRLLKEGDIVGRNFLVEVPFDYVNQHIFMQARINDSPKEYRFILDTGARTVLSKAVAEELGLLTLGTMNIGDANQETIQEDVAHVRLAIVDIGGALFLNTAAAVYDFNTSPKRDCLYCRETNRLDGVIGSNLMKLAVWQIDYAAGKIKITDNKALLAQKPKSYSIPFYTGRVKGTPGIPLRSGKDVLGIFALDTGCTFSIISSKEVFDAYRKWKKAPCVKGIGVSGSTMYGTFSDDLYVAKATNLKLGTLRIREVLMAFTENAANLIGNGFLENFIVTLDWKKQRLTLSPLPGRSIITDLYSFGFSYDFSDDRLLVTFLYENSPAHDADLRIGDQILLVNGRDVSSVNLDDYCSILEKGLYDPAAESLDLVILQAGIERSLTLERAELFTQ